MNKNVRKITQVLLFSLAMGASTASMAQVKLPAASSATSITQALGIHDITLKYNRPNANGRQIFGSLVPYNEVWRAGANGIPTLTFAEQVSIEGHKVAAGTYGLLTIPGEQEWTIILSKNANQWGAYKYDASENVLSFKVKSQSLNRPVETFTIAFEEVKASSAKLSLSWEKTRVDFSLVVDQKAEIMASIDAAMRSAKKPYFQAAQYYYNNDLDLKKAVEWATEAEKENDKAPHIRYWKARIQLKAGDKKGAIQTAQKGVELAEAAKNPEYIKLNQQVIAEAQ